MVKRNLKRQRPSLPGLPEIVEAQPRLEPIIGNLYGTPPVDPTDCSLFPDSPSCGGMPFSKLPIDASVDLVLDNCNVGMQLNSVFGFVRMPSVQVVYRNPKCRLEPPEKELPEPPTGFNEVHYEEYPPSCQDYQFVVDFYDYTIDYIDGQYLPSNQFIKQPWQFDYLEHKITLVKLKPYILRYDEQLGRDIQACEITMRYRGTSLSQRPPIGSPVDEFIDEYEITYYLNDAFELGITCSDPRNIFRGNISCEPRRDNQSRARYIRLLGLHPRNETRVFMDRGNIRTYFNYHGRPASTYDNRKNYLAELAYFWSEGIKYQEETSVQADTGYEPYNEILTTPVRNIQITAEYDSTWYGTDYYAVTLDSLQFQEHLFRRMLLCDYDISGDGEPPPFNDDMGCNCCPKIKENDALLRLILKRIGKPTTVDIFDENLERQGTQKAKRKPSTLFEANKLSTERSEIANRIIGVASFPVEVPDTVIEASREGLDKVIYDFFTNKTRKINSIAEFIYWMAEQDSAVLGQFHQQIEFESANEQSGRLEKDLVTIPNVAEALKEIILLLVQMANNDALENVGTVKILAELSNIKVNLFKTMQTVIDMQDYMDYPTNTREVDVDLPVNFELTKDGLDFEDFYSQSKGSFTFEDWTGENSLHDNMLDLLQLATIMRALFYDRSTG